MCLVIKSQSLSSSIEQIGRLRHRKHESLLRSPEVRRHNLSRGQRGLLGTLLENTSLPPSLLVLLPVQILWALAQRDRSPRHDLCHRKQAGKCPGRKNREKKPGTRYRKEMSGLRGASTHEGEA